jgi:hypothetical protein
MNSPLSLAGRTLFAVAAVTSALVLAACGSDVGGDGSAATLASVGGTGCTANEKCAAPARPGAPAGSASIAAVEIVEKGMLLTANGQQRQLSARAYDAKGSEVTGVAVAWTSSRPDVIAVGAGGLAVAGPGQGAAQIVAEVAGVRSAPLVALRTPVGPGANLVDDGQIVGDPVASTQTQNAYVVVLDGVPAPALDSLLVGTGSKPVAGRVSSVQTAGGRHTVTLRPAPVRDVFSDLRIDESIDLSTAPATIDPALLAGFDVQREGGRFTLRPRTGVTAKALATMPVRVVRKNAPPPTPAPFTSCDYAYTGQIGSGLPLPFEVSGLPEITIDVSKVLEVRFGAGSQVERLATRGDVELAASMGLRFDPTFEGKLTCRLALGSLNIPVGGAASFAFGGRVSLEFVVEFDGSLRTRVAEVGFDARSRLEGVQAGLECPPAGTPGGVCSYVGSWTGGSASLKPRVEMAEPVPTDFGARHGLIVRPSAQATLAIGDPFGSVRLETARVRTGPLFSGNFESIRPQVVDRAFRAAYGVTHEISVDIGQDLPALAGWLGIAPIVGSGASMSAPVAASPKGTITVDKPQFSTGERVRAQLDLDADATRFRVPTDPSFYNVGEVLLVRRPSDSLPGEPAQVVQRLPAAQGQTRFDFDFMSPFTGSAGELFAFVVTRLLPGDGFALEVASLDATVLQARVGTYASSIGRISTITSLLVVARGADGLPPAQNVPLTIQGPPGWNGGNPLTTVVYPANRQYYTALLNVPAVSGDYVVSANIGSRQLAAPASADVSSWMAAPTSAATAPIVPQPVAIAEISNTRLRLTWNAPAGAVSTFVRMQVRTIGTDVANKTVTGASATLEGFTIDASTLHQVYLLVYNADLTSPNPVLPQQFNVSGASRPLPQLLLAQPSTVPGGTGTLVVSGFIATLDSNHDQALVWATSRGSIASRINPDSNLPEPNTGVLTLAGPGEYKITAASKAFPGFFTSTTITVQP